MTSLSTQFPQTAAVITEGIARGLHLGAQIYVSVNLTTLADAALGQARPGEALTPEHMLVWMSSSKPIAAVAIGQLWEQGKLELDDPVCLHLPAFQAGGKEKVTIRHLLTHTGGIRLLNLGWPGASWDEILARIYRRRLEPRWEPGEKAAYHIASSWFVLGELVQRLSQQLFSRYVRERIMEPAGMASSWIGMMEDEYRRIQDRMGEMYDCQGETPKRLPWTSAQMVIHPNPARNGVGPIRELGRFYEMLLRRGEHGEETVLNATTVEALTARHRVGMYDHTFRHVVDWGLGFIPDSKQYGASTIPYGYGNLCSRETFGHSGYQSSTAFCDRRHRLVVALVFNGTPGPAAHDLRMRSALEAIYRDLGLAGVQPSSDSISGLNAHSPPGGG